MFFLLRLECCMLIVVCVLSVDLSLLVGVCGAMLVVCVLFCFVFVVALIDVWFVFPWLVVVLFCFIVCGLMCVICCMCLLWCV